MTADVTQWEHSNIKFYASVFSNILITRIFILFYSHVFPKKLKIVVKHTFQTGSK